MKLQLQLLRPKQFKTLVQKSYSIIPFSYGDIFGIIHILSQGENSIPLIDKSCRLKDSFLFYYFFSIEISHLFEESCHVAFKFLSG